MASLVLDASSALEYMELAYAFLAERADRLQDGRLVVFGGDADSIQVTLFPFLLTASLVVKATLNPDEPLEGHTLAVDITGSDGVRHNVMKAVPISTTRNQMDPQQASGANVIVNMSLKIDGPGHKQIHVVIDGSEVRKLSLWISQTEKAD